MVLTTTKIIEELEKALGQKAYISLKELVSLGIFGSKFSALAAVREGRISSFRISRLRIVVSRAEVVRFMVEKFTCDHPPQKKVKGKKSE